MAAGEIVALNVGKARADVMPRMGAGLAGLWVDGLPVLRPWNGVPQDGPFALAMNLLAPFSNRIDMRFEFNGKLHELQPNLENEPFPIHGDAFMRPWSVNRFSQTELVLALEDGQFGPWQYRAECHYALGPTRLDVTLSITSLSTLPLPFGLGFHPWFPRSAGTRIAFNANSVWMENTDHLRQSDCAAPLSPEWDFRLPGSLPDGWINNGFDGWDGRMKILHAAGAQDVEMVTRDLSTLIVYSPSSEADFFCAEPVSHPVDAHNLPDQPGLVVLNTHQALTRTMSLHW